jgi:hypothetical protein
MHPRSIVNANNIKIYNAPAMSCVKMLFQQTQIDIPIYFASNNLPRKEHVSMYICLVADQSIGCDIDFVHVNIFNLLIKIYLSLIFIKYFINESNI